MMIRRTADYEQRTKTKPRGRRPRQRMRVQEAGCRKRRCPGPVVPAADQSGLLWEYYADPQFIKTGCFPLKPKMRLDRISNLIEELVSAGLFIPYEVDGRKLLHIAKFEDHQPRKLVHKAARFPNFRAETRTEVKLSGANQQLSSDHTQLTTSVINKIDPCVSDSVCVGVSGKPKPLPSVR